jgi:tetratricopeptide (TPR) repeat protein
LAEVELELHNYDLALHHFRVALELREDANALWGIGMCLKSQGELEQAREAFLHGLDLAPDAYFCLLALGQMDVEAGQGAAALKWLEPATHLKPKEYDARYALAKALLFAGRSAEAKPHFQFVAAARLELARVKSLREHVASHPADAEARYEIGKRLAQYGDEGEAMQWLTSVLAYAPDHALAQEALADLREELGR